ncbi:Hypothetical_protein [Hexamita inflata]|uniref:Hypothetical_protein n=1 Tax=Hexamita inflata TaxID=28002 RepID=A0AA86P1F6_9EUKA|nr:Hypothetical protein HINF_LOCUS17779 [Hexamita inflata]
MKLKFQNQNFIHCPLMAASALLSCSLTSAFSLLLFSLQKSFRAWIYSFVNSVPLDSAAMYLRSWASPKLTFCMFPTRAWIRFETPNCVFSVRSQTICWPMLWLRIFPSSQQVISTVWRETTPLLMYARITHYTKCWLTICFEYFC